MLYQIVLFVHLLSALAFMGSHGVSITAAFRIKRYRTAAEVTLSIGVSCLQPGAASALQAIYAHADRALYEAKAFGRNQVVA